jgi:TPP-dependent pyruvate/acetoin dehydrogenase alpha subunit
MYRSKGEVARWEEKDPLKYWSKELLTMGISATEIAEIDAQIEQELKEAVNFAEQSPLPTPADAYTDIFTPHSAEV